MKRLLILATAFVVALGVAFRPAPGAAQCVKCIDQLCRYGPWANPDGSHCDNSSGCIAWGKCGPGETFAPSATPFDADGFARDKRLVARATLDQALPLGSGVLAAKDCRGLIVGLAYTAASATSMRQQLSRLTV